MRAALAPLLRATAELLALTLFVAAVLTWAAILGGA